MDFRQYNVSEFDEWLPTLPPDDNGAGGDRPFTVPPTIRAGARNDLLYRSARSLHAKGFSVTAIRAALTAENREKCQPPLPQDEVDAIAAHAARQADRPDFGPDPAAPADGESMAPPSERFPAFCTRLQTRQIARDLVPGYLPGTGIVMVHGQPRSQKTWILKELARACATGTPAFGLAQFAVADPLNIWYLTEEDPELVVRDRFCWLLAGRHIETLPDRLHVSSQRGIWFDDPQWQQRLLAYIQDTEIRALIIDPVRASSWAVDQGPRELAPLVRFLRRIIHTTTCGTIVLGHHDVKPIVGRSDDRARPLRASGGGIFSIATAPMHADLVDPVRHQTLLTPGYFKLSVSPDPLLVTLSTDHPQHPTWARVDATPTTIADAIQVALQQQVCDYLAEHPASSGAALAKGLGRRKADVMAAVTRLERAGRVDSFTKGPATCWHLIPHAEAT